LTGYGQDVMREAGPDKVNALNQPDFVAKDILEGVRWVLKDRA